MNICNSEIATRLKEARIKAGHKSARSFAQRHNISYITYSQHENGKRGINSETLMSYAKHLSVSAAWLLSGDNINDIPNQKEYSQKCLINKNELLEIYDQVFKISNVMGISIGERICFETSISVYNKIIEQQDSGFGVFKLISDALISASDTNKSENELLNKKAG